MKIGHAIKKLRKDAVLNQKTYAWRIGITQTYLSLIESGKRTPNMSVIEKISEFHEVPISILFWFSLEESEVSETKKEYYRLIKPTLDRLIESIL